LISERLFSGIFQPVMLFDSYLERGYTLPALGASRRRLHALGDGSFSAAAYNDGPPDFTLRGNVNVSRDAVVFSAGTSAVMLRQNPFYISMARGVTVAVRLEVLAAVQQVTPIMQLWTQLRGRSVLQLSWLPVLSALQLVWRDANGDAQLRVTTPPLQAGLVTAAVFRVALQVPYIQVFMNGHNASAEVRCCTASPRKGLATPELAPARVQQQHLSLLPVRCNLIDRFCVLQASALQSFVDVEHVFEIFPVLHGLLSNVSTTHDSDPAFTLSHLSVHNRALTPTEIALLSYELIEPDRNVSGFLAGACSTHGVSKRSCSVDANILKAFSLTSSHDTCCALQTRRNSVVYSV
jgi:hypothetical protein